MLQAAQQWTSLNHDGRRWVKGAGAYSQADHSLAQAGLGPGVFTKNGFKYDRGEPWSPRVLILRSWLTDEVMISIQFTEDQRVFCKDFYGFRPESYPAKLWRRIREWLR
jgi:hypothetical protein